MFQNGNEPPAPTIICHRIGLTGCNALFEMVFAIVQTNVEKVGKRPHLLQ